jgi:hypothetical protein
LNCILIQSVTQGSHDPQNINASIRPNDAGEYDGPFDSLLVSS